MLRSVKLSLLLATALPVLTAAGQHKEHQDHDQSDAFWAALARNHTGRYVIEAGPLKAQSPDQLHELGEWSSVIEWPHIPVSAANLPDGRVITWASNRVDAFPSGEEFTFAAVWNPDTGAFVETPNHTHDMFCAHMVMLPDGRLLVNGGRNHVKTTSIFDFTTNSWSQTFSMNHGRWYPTSVAMPDGTVFTASGSGQPNAADTAELWVPGQGWDELDNIDWRPIADHFGFESHWWPHLFVDPDGDIFHGGPTDRMHRVTVAGEGSLTDLGSWLPDAWYSKHAAVAMYDEGKIIIAGGAGTATADPSTNRVILMDITGTTPVTREIAPMQYPRRFASAVVLPNGEVLVVGGNTSGFKFSDNGTILPAEIWNPDTETWRTVASISEPRNYHSVALLLEDGSVLSAGGGLCGGGCSANHQDGQVYTPPYLFDANGNPAARPSIASAPAAVGYGETFNVTATGNVAYFSLVKASATTHAVNTDQRYLRIDIAAQTGNQYQLASHTNPNVLTPGYWMMFAVDQSGTPSRAHSILVSGDITVAILSIPDQVSQEGDLVSLPVERFVPDGVSETFSATGLPPGLSIDQGTGLISGTVGEGAAGLYAVTVTLDADGITDTADFTWSVRSGGTGSILREWWTGIGGDEISDLTADARYPDSPSGTEYLELFEAARNISDFYGARFRGYLHPLETGLYRFWIASDNHSRLLLSTTASPADAAQVASVTGHTGSRDWEKFGSQESALIQLEAGRIYYIEVLHKEGAGGDNLAVAWETPSRLREVIPGSFLSPFNGAPAVGRPSDRSDPVGSTVSLQIQADDPENDPLTYSATGLPAGLSISSGTGLISGTLQTPGVATVTVSVTDGTSVSSTQFQWTVTSDQPPLEIVSVSAPPAEVGTAAQMALTVSGPTSYSVSWNFGDGATESGGASTSHVYAEPGRYFVTATVTAGQESSQVSFFQNVHNPVATQAPRQSTSVLADGQGRVWNTNPDNNSVTVTQGAALTRLAEIPVGIKPVSLAIGGGNVYVVNKESNDISVISLSSLVRTQTLTLPRASQPHGIVVSPDNVTAFVVLEATGRLMRLNLASGQGQISDPRGPWLRHVSLTGDGAFALVTRFITPPVAGESTAQVSTAGGGEILYFRTNDLELERIVTLAYNNVVDTPDRARGIANYLSAVSISPDGTSGWIPSKFDNIFRGQLRDGQSREHDRLVRGGVSVINVSTGVERVVDRLDIDDQSHPVAGVFGPRGNVLFVAHSGSRSVTALDPHLGQAITRISVGRAPTGLTLSADGRTLFVHNYMDRTLQAVDVSRLTGGGSNIAAPSLGTASVVSVEALSQQVLRGKQLFNDAFDDRLSAQDYLSCASCHAGGSHDGRVWDMTDGGEGLRNTIDLRGRAGTDHGPVHWTANFDEIHDFENDIRGVFDGTGLLSNADFQQTQNPLGPLKAGRSADLDALAAYVASLSEAGSSPYRNADGSLPATAAAGREVFRAADCASCHTGSRFTDSPGLILHDIGTLKASSGNRLGQPLTGIDTPTLRGAWATAPYLHDGSAPTLGDAVTAHGGVTLSASDLDALVAYLRVIDDDEASAPAAGSPPVMAPVAEQSTLLEASVSLQLSATEPDGDPVTYSANGLPQGLLVSDNGLISGAPTVAGVFQVTARATDQDGSDAVQFVWRVLQTDTPVVSTCYLVADNSGGADVATMLVDGVETAIGPTGTRDIEGIAYSGALGALFAADAGDFGQINLGTGAFSFIGTFGSGDGPDGADRDMDDVDGMAFHPATGVLYGSVATTGGEDYLIAVNPATGSVIPDHFGAGQDYILIGTVDGVQDVDDIAIDPISGVMYGVGTRSGGTRLFTIDMTSGNTSLIGLVGTEIEGLGFMSDGRLFGTTGDNRRTVVELNKVTAGHQPVATLGAGGSDYESIDCMGPTAQQTFAGRVFQDLDEDGVFGAGDAGFGGAVVDLFKDDNGNGAVDASDTFLRSVTSASDGSYEFRLGSLGAFVARADYGSLPPGATPVGDNAAVAVFAAEGDSDLDNHFPFFVDQSESDLFCYAVADEGAGLGDGDVLTRWNKGSLVESTVGPLGTQLTEAMAFNPQQTTLYAANGRRFGSVNTTTGAFTEIGTFGNGQGPAGGVTFSDVDGLTFDPNTGELFGAVRRNGSEDLLIRINPQTGTAVSGAFSTGDYVVIQSIDGRRDVDDLAIDPVTGQMYALLNGDSGAGRLVTINRQTGATTFVADLDDGTLEGLTFDGDGTLLATRGSTFQEVVTLNRSTGASTLLAALGVDGHRDYEAIDCLTNPTNTTAGRIYADLNASGGFDAQDAVLPDVQVGLYRDLDADGEGDILLTTVTTDFAGQFAFRTASEGRFVVAPLEGNAVKRRVHHPGFGLRSEDNDFVVGLGTSTASDEPRTLPEAFALEPAYPNPFNPLTTIEFDLPRTVAVRLEVFDLTGRRVDLLADETLAAGRHRVRFDASGLPSGVYFYRMIAEGVVQTRSVVLVK